MKKIKIKATVACLFFVCFFVAAAQVSRADYSVIPGDSYVFSLTSAKNEDWKQYWDGFQFTFERIQENDGGAVIGSRLTFDLTQFGYGEGLDAGKDTVKFKSFSAPWLNELFTASSLNGAWSNKGWTPTYVDLIFKTDVNWDDFAYLAETSVLEMHIQSIGVSNFSINQAVFTHLPGGNTAATPEPAALLIFGVGAIGMGTIALRRKQQRQ